MRDRTVVVVKQESETFTWIVTSGEQWSCLMQRTDGDGTDLRGGKRASLTMSWNSVLFVWATMSSLLGAENI